MKTWLPEILCLQLEMQMLIGKAFETLWPKVAFKWTNVCKEVNNRFLDIQLYVTAQSLTPTHLVQRRNFGKNFISRQLGIKEKAIEALSSNVLIHTMNSTKSKKFCLKDLAKEAITLAVL